MSTGRLFGLSETSFGNFNSRSSKKFVRVLLVAVAVRARNGTSRTSDRSSFRQPYQPRNADFFSLLLDGPNSVTECTSSTTIPIRFSWNTSLPSILLHLSVPRVDSGDINMYVTLPSWTFRGSEESRLPPPTYAAWTNHSL